MGIARGLARLRPLRLQRLDPGQQRPNLRRLGRNLSRLGVNEQRLTLQKGLLLGVGQPIEASETWES